MGVTCLKLSAMSKYTRLDSYDEFEMPDEETTIFNACCDCGMVHMYVLAEEIETGRRCVIVIRDERRTAQLRRHEYGDLHNGNGKWRLIRNEEI